MRVIRPVIAVFFLAVLFASAAGAGAAQEATADATPGGPSEGYPVAIHEGTCDEPASEPAWEVGDALSIGVDQDEPEVVGLALTRTVTVASSALDFTLDSVADSDYVIAVHASPADQGTLVACGQIAGVKVDGKLVVPLVPVGESEVTGLAILDEDSAGVLDLGEGQTYVTVYVTAPGDEDAGTPMA